VTAYLVVVSYSSLPSWDGWIQIDFAANEGPSHTLDWLWRQHNEARMATAKLLLLADLRWFHATQTFLLASIFVIQLLHLWLLGWSMRVLGEWHGALWRTGFGLAVFCLFCPSQRGTFMWGFHTCFVLSGLFATISFIGLLLYWMRSRGPPAKGRRSGSVYRGSAESHLFLCQWKSALAIAVAAALLLRLRIAAVQTFAISDIVSTAVYLHNYRPSYASLDSTVMICKYLAAYFGSSFVPTTDDVLQGTAWMAELMGLPGCSFFSCFSCDCPPTVGPAVEFNL
jgi:hypothetical protein